MKYTVDNVTLDMDLGDSEFQGQVSFTIPFAHKEFLKEWCGAEKEFDGHQTSFENGQFGPVFVDSDDMCYRCDSPDWLIAYVSWLFKQDGEHTVAAQYSHPYWGIHDMEHAKNDEAGCTIYVDGPIEEQRIIDGFSIMVNLGIHPTLEMIEDIQGDFKRRFKYYIHLEEFLEYDEAY